jgi:HEAT repeat protein
MNKLLGALVLVVVVGSFFAYRFFKGPSDSVVTAAPQTVSVQAVIDRDKDVLAVKPRGQEASEQAIVTSLKRLSFSARNDVLPYITKYQDHPSLQVRAAAVEAAGALNSAELTKFLEGKLASEDSLIRVAALKGLMRHQSPEHLEIIKKHASRLNTVVGGKEGKIPKADAIWTSLALARITQSEKERGFYVTKVLERLNVDGLENAAEADAREAAHQVLNVFQGDERAVSFAEALLEKGKDDELALHALQFSIAYNKKWLADKVGELPLRQMKAYQSELIRYLNQDCPPQTRQIAVKLDESLRSQIKCRIQ